MNDTLTRAEQAEQVEQDAPGKVGGLRRRLSLLLASVASLLFGGAVVLSGGAAFAQTTTPTLPDASTTAENIVNTGGSQLANTAVAVLPYVIAVLVLFWAINFALKKVGLTGRAKVH